MRCLILALALCLGTTLPARARGDAPAAHQVPPNPARAAYEYALRTRLLELGHEEEALRHDDVASTYRRRKIMGFVFGSVGIGGALACLYARAFATLSEGALTDAEEAVFGGAITTFGLGGLVGYGFALQAVFGHPYRGRYRQLRTEKRDVLRELNRLRQQPAAQLSLSPQGLRLRF